MRTSICKYLDEAMIRWFKQTMAEGFLISGPIYAEQTNCLQYSLSLEGDFKAYSEWLMRCNECYCIRELPILKIA